MRVGAMLLTTALVVVAGSWTVVRGQDLSAAELHALFEARCGRCHGHAGTLVHDRLTLDDGTLVDAKTGRDIGRFLQHHFPPPDPAQAGALYGMLVRIAEGRGRFKRECGLCHERASDLARLELVVDDGILRGRYTGRDIRSFLAGHGRLEGEGVDFFHALLLWQTRP